MSKNNKNNIIEEKPQNKGCLKWKPYFMVLFWIGLFICTYNIGKFHGNIEMIMKTSKFEDVCEVFGSEERNAIHNNETCFVMADEGNNTYQVGDHLLFQSSDEMAWDERLIIGIVLGITDIHKVSYEKGE